VQSACQLHAPSKLVTSVVLCCVHILKWPFIVPSTTKCTCVMIMLFNQLFDMPHLLGVWIIGPSCPVAQLVRTASSRQSPGSSICFQFPNDGDHCALGNFQHSRHFIIPRYIPLYNLRDLLTVPWTLGYSFCSDMHC
jgi:hypothetical protein